MADLITRMRLDSAEYDQKIKRAQQNLLSFEQQCRATGQSMSSMSKDNVEYVRALGQMETVSKNVRGRLNELTTAFTELSVQYKHLTDEEKQSDFGKALNSSLGELKTRINEAKSELNDVNRELSETTTTSDGTSSALDALAGKFGINIKQLTGLGAAIAAVKAALDVAKDAFFQSENNIDDWERTIESAKGAYSMFLDTLNGGDWTNFFKNLSEAVRGARDLFDAFDRLGSVKANNQLAIAMAQAQIQQLRTLKQQGADVDQQIKNATERLKYLQMQSVGAGKQAGAMQLATVLQRRVNAAGGRGVVSSADIGHAAAEYARGGQAYMDQQQRIYQSLYAAGSKVQPVHDWASNTYKNIRVFNIDNLTKEQQKQYIISKAVTEGETELQKGLATLTQAVNEEAGMFRDELRGNRYALQGSSGGAGSKGGTEKTFDEGIQGLKLFDDGTIKTTESMAELRAQLSQFQQALANATNAADYRAAEAGIQRTKEQIAVQDVAVRFGIDTESMLQFKKDVEQQMQAAIGDRIIPIEIKAEPHAAAQLEEDGKKVTDSWSTAASVVRSVGSALSNIENPAGKVVAIIAEAIANIAAGYAAAIGKEGKNSKNIWAFIASAAAAVVEMGVSIAEVKKQTKYSTGGIIKGNSYSGDLIAANGGEIGLNAGEIVLNRAQAGNLASQLQGGGGNDSYKPSYITGEQIWVALNRYTRRSGKGEIATWIY